MRVLATALLLLSAPGALLAEGRSDLDILHARCSEQERQIRALEEEIESLHSQLALERRRSRGVVPSATPASPVPAVVQASYTVKSGDTLSSIARRYRTSADVLMKTNGIEDATRLRVGQKLTLPAEISAPKDPSPIPAAEPKPAEMAEAPAPKAAPQTVAAKAAAATGSYQVQRGDTLYGIARKHKMSIAELKALNPKVADKIITGQSLAVSGSPKPSPGSSSSPTLGSSSARTISTPSSPPDPKPSVPSKGTEAKKAAAPEKPSAPEPARPTTASAPKPEPQPAAATKTEEPAPTPAPAAPRTISSIFVMDEVSLGDLAAKHGTTTEQLNALNNWNYKSNLILARGSEVYVPSN